MQRLLDDSSRTSGTPCGRSSDRPGLPRWSSLTLALGIGATTAIYSVVDTILLQPLPFPDSDRLVRVVENFPQSCRADRRCSAGLPIRSFSTGARAPGHSPTPRRSSHGATNGADPQGAAGLWGAMASGNTFTLLGARAMLGRTLVSGDDANPDVVVLSFDTWQRHFNADPDIVGTATRIPGGRVLAANSAAAADGRRRAAGRLRVSDRAARFLHADRSRPRESARPRST